MKNDQPPFYWTHPEGYPPEQCAPEGWYQWTRRGIVYLGKTILSLDDIDEASAALLKAAEERIDRLEAEIKRLNGLIFKHHDIGYIMRAAEQITGDCEICTRKQA